LTMNHQAQSRFEVYWHRGKKQEAQGKRRIL